MEEPGSSMMFSKYGSTSPALIIVSKKLIIVGLRTRAAMRLSPILLDDTVLSASALRSLSPEFFSMVLETIKNFLLRYPAVRTATILSASAIYYKPPV